jgi:hypothetical protein
MGYNGQTYTINYAAGGYQYAPRIDSVPPSAFVGESQNFNCANDGKHKRGGTSYVYEDIVVGSPRIMGMTEYKLPLKTYRVFGASDGKVYKNELVSIKSGMSTTNHYSFAVMDGELYITDGETTPQTWDGASDSTANITSPSLDWATDAPIAFIVHGKGASQRLWAIRSKGVDYSSLNNGKEFNGGTSGFIPVETGDDTGIVGGVELGDRIILFGRKKAFIIDDEDVDTGNWGYQAAQWEGGAANHRMIVRTPNDVFVGTTDGDFYTISAVQSYGDYKKASVARPAMIDRFMREKVFMANVADFHAVYDARLQAIKVFVAMDGSTTVNGALVYFFDRDPAESWSIHKNEDYASGYDASCSAAVEGATGTPYVLTGDYDGRIWRLEDQSYSDNGNPYSLILRKPGMVVDNIRGRKEFKRTIYQAEGGGYTDITCTSYIDGEEVVERDEQFNDGAPVWGEIVWGEFVYGSGIPKRFASEIGGKGISVETKIEHATAGQPFAVHTQQIDYKPIGASPEK